MTTRLTVSEPTISKLLKFNSLLFSLFLVIQLGIVKLFHLDSLEEVMEFHWQFVDSSLLKSAPLETIFLNHAQPPMLNLLVFIFLQLPFNIYQAFIIFNAICMSIVCLIIFNILSKAVNRFIAIIFSLTYCALPSVLLNVSYPFYTCVSALGYSLIVYGFWKTFHRSKIGVVFFVIGLMVVNNTRTSFTFLHVAILITLFIVLNLRMIRHNTPLLLVLAFTGVLSLVVPTKNLLLYDFFGSSSWINQTVASGWKLNAPLGYFPTPEKIKVNYPDLVCRNIHTQLDIQERKSNGHPNFHSCLVLEYSKILESQGLDGYSLGKHIRSIYGYTLEYLSLPDSYMFLNNRDQIWFYSELMKLPQLSITLQLFQYGGTYSVRFTLVLILILLAISLFRKPDEFIKFSFLLLSLHFLTYTLSEGIESRRHIFEVEFLYVILLPILLKKFRRGDVATLDRRNHNKIK